MYTNNNLFFTITINNQETHFSSDQYTFTIKDSEQKTGTRGNALWYYDFDHPSLALQWLSWNQKSNATKSWEYLLLKVKETLYSGFLNKSRTQEQVYYCKLEPVPPQANFEIIY